MDIQPAEFVRFVADHERLDDLLDEAKADTWMREAEHALLIVDMPHPTGLSLERAALVRGGKDGILLQSTAGKLWMDIEGQRSRVIRLAWHVHPRVTGPSDHDFHVLELLDQQSTMLFEIGGAPEGTRITRRGSRSE